MAFQSHRDGWVAVDYGPAAPVMVDQDLDLKHKIDKSALQKL